MSYSQSIEQKDEFQSISSFQNSFREVSQRQFRIRQKYQTIEKDVCQRRRSYCIIIASLCIIQILIALFLFYSKVQIQQEKTYTSKQNGSPTVQLNSQNRIKIKPIQQIQSKLPLDLPIIFQFSNKTYTIQTYLYQDNITRQTRRMFATQRTQYLDTHKDYQSIHLAKYNIILSEHSGKKAKDQNQAEWQRLQKRYNLSSVDSQLQMCVIVPSFNNAANFRCQHNLNSILTQNYSNYRVIIINDASTDNTFQLYRKYFEFYNIPSNKYILLDNKQRRGALQNLYNTSLSLCSNQSIVIHVDGDDQLIGRNVFKMFNWAYQINNANVVYSNYYFYRQPTKIIKGLSTQFHYSSQEIKGNNFRDVRMKFSHLRSYRNVLTFKIKEKDLKDQDNKFYSYAADIAIFMPVLQLACTKIYQIVEEFHYLYNGNTGLNDGQFRKKQIQVQKEIKARPKYGCYNQTQK